MEVYLTISYIFTNPKKSKLQTKTLWRKKKIIGYLLLFINYSKANDGVI